MAVYGHTSVGMTWEYLPRCPACKKWVSPASGVCNYKLCKSKGEQVVRPTGWPPQGARVVGSRAKAEATLEQARLDSFGALSGQFTGHTAESLETQFDAALAAVPPDSAEVAAAADGPAPRNMNDHRISPADNLGAGGPKAKYKDNVAAIRLLKELEAEDRPATEDEKKVLARYVGWGGLSQAYNPSHGGPRGQWQQEYQELRELLTPDEYESARATTPNAHYTSTEVISGMWQALEHLGVQGGNTLEPSAGVGHFLGLMPEQMAQQSFRQAVELDDLTGRILGKLYPDADVTIGGYETTNIPAESVDLAVGNVPFGDYGVYDPAFEKPGQRHLSRRIHNYFFARALKDVKPGGTIAFITSHHTMDAKDPAVREYLASQADLLGAIRLPNTAFKQNAGTEVTTDVLFLRKRHPDEAPGDTSWVHTTEMPLQYKDASEIPMHVNQYFHDNPQMALGTLKATGTMYAGRAELTLESDERSLEAAMAEAIQHLPKGAAAPRVTTRCPDCGAFAAADGACNNPMCPGKKQTSLPPMLGMREGGMVAMQGKVYQHQAGQLTEVTLKHAKDAGRITDLLALRDEARQVLRANLTDTTDDELAALQDSLRHRYDAFVAEHGYITSDRTRKLLQDEPDLPFLMSLEEKNTDGTITPAAIFSQRTLNRYDPPETVETATEALMVSLNETGQLEWGRMTKLLGKTEAEVQQDLLDAGRVFRDPNGAVVLTEDYLSGNIREKLALAEAAAARDPVYQPNVDALRAVHPVELTSDDIKANLGAGWIAPAYIQEFADEHLGLAGLRVDYNRSAGQFVVAEGSSFRTYSVANQQTWGTEDFTGAALLAMALNGKTPKVYDEIALGGNKVKKVVNQVRTLAARETQDKIKREFEGWVWQDETRRTDLEETYNRRFNSTVPRHYDGSHLELPGSNPNITLRPHQKNAAWRIASSPNNVLLGHIVGAGKTFTMIAGAEEHRRLNGGKAMHVVPNHILDQYASDVFRLYPNSRVLTLAAKDIGKKEKRAEMLNRIATGDYDTIVLTHDAFNRIPIRNDTEQALLRREIDALDEALYDAKQQAGGRPYSHSEAQTKTIKEIEKIKKRTQEKLQKAAHAQATDADMGLTFEDLGIGSLSVDEAHEYKNLAVQTGRDRLPGIPATSSAKAFNMYLKTNYLSNRCSCGRFIGDSGLCADCGAGTKENKGKLVFATGTPVANTMGEAYVMQKYLDYDRLKEMDLHNFDAWAGQFGETVTALEMKPDGSGYREHTRWAKFVNLPEMMRIWGETADFQTDPDKMNLVRPDVDGGKPTTFSAPSSPWLKDFIQDCAARAEQLSTVDPSVDNMLKIVSDARKAALDRRLIDPALDDDPDSKVNQAVGEIRRIYDETTGATLEGEDGSHDLTQMVFLDLSTPNYGRQHKAFEALRQATDDRTAARVILAGWPLDDAAKFQQTVLDVTGDETRAATLTRQLSNAVGFEPGDDFNVYNDMKLKLVAEGIPTDEIAFIHDATTDKARKELFDKVNAGKVRVLFGSTGKMGTGTNAQKRLKALHHLDAPWRPADVEQREGRILRQGNLNKAITINRYATEGSFDVYSWQTLETKAKFINQVMGDPDNPERSAEDVDAAVIGYAEMKAIATGNPAIIREIQLKQNLDKLGALAKGHRRQQRSVTRELDTARRNLPDVQQNLEKWRSVQEAAPPRLEAFELTLGDQTYGPKDKQKAGRDFEDLLKQAQGNHKRFTAGSINGYPVRIVGQGHGKSPQVEVVFGPGAVGTSPVSNQTTRTMTHLFDTANDTIGTEAIDWQLLEKQQTQRIAELEVQAGKPFERQAEFDRVQTKLREVQAELEAMRREGEAIILDKVGTGDSN